MAKTKKAIRHKRKKVLQKRMKEQTRNAAMIVKRIAKIKKDIWKLDLEDFKELGLLSQLTWEYENRVRLMGCTAIGFRSVETTGNSKVVKKIQKWIWKHDNKEFIGEVRFFTTDIDGYQILTALKMDWAEDDDYCEHEDRKTVTVFTIDAEETGTGHNAEEVALTYFAEKWDMKAEIK